jgi:hypothetical protein
LFTEDDLGFVVVASRFPPLLSSAVVGGCLIASLVLDTNEGPDVNSLYWVNTMRDSFTCNPRFSGLRLNSPFCVVVKLVHFLSLSRLLSHHPSSHVIEFALEVIFVHAHFIVCGAAMVMGVISIFLTLRRVLHKSGVQPTPHFEPTSLTLNQKSYLLALIINHL